MQFIYAASTCSDKVYKELFSNTKLKPASAIQKYHRLLIEGLAAHAQVDVVANPPVHKGILERPWTTLPKEQIGNACYHHLPAIRNSLVKRVYITMAAFWKTLTLLRKDSAVILDCLNRTVSLACLLAARIRGCRCVAIVTDLPDILLESALAKKLSYFVIRHCTDYVLLTEAMNEVVNPKGKPYIILEGHSDIHMREHTVSLENKEFPRICLYAGTIGKQYGLDKLVEGFRKANIPDTRLELYGTCDNEEEFLESIRGDERIFYGGVRLNSEIVEREKAATLLVNPWLTQDEKIKYFLTYSFPSKNMEYMASGTPMLTTVIPGMPEEYHPYVYLLRDESEEGFAAALKDIFTRSDEELMEKGLAAKEFVLNHKNNVIQAKKIVDMLK